jgi:hypothetical protein
MVLGLRVDIFQNGRQLTRAHRKRTVSPLPKETAVSGVACFHPLRRRFLDLLDQLRLRNGSWQARNDVNMIGDSADMYEFGSEVAADGGEISMHARPQIRIEPRLAILRAKDYVEDDLAEGLRHGRVTRLVPNMNRAFSADDFRRLQSWGVAPG